MPCEVAGCRRFHIRCCGRFDLYADGRGLLRMLNGSSKLGSGVHRACSEYSFLQAGNVRHLDSIRSHSSHSSTSAPMFQRHSCYRPKSALFAVSDAGRTLIQVVARRVNLAWTALISTVIQSVQDPDTIVLSAVAHLRCYFVCPNSSAVVSGKLLQNPDSLRGVGSTPASGPSTRT